MRRDLVLVGDGVVINKGRAMRKVLAGLGLYVVFGTMMTVMGIVITGDSVYECAGISFVASALFAGFGISMDFLMGLLDE